MNERTTIGGVQYNVVGTDLAPLLLKNKSGIKIQFGSKFIDLIKNGKLAVADNSIQIGVVKEESEIKKDGIYVIDDEKSLKLLVLVNNKSYNLIGTDLYISASTKLENTVELQKQALENIGIYYNSLEELQNAGIQNGLAYVLEDTSLYTIKDGVVNEFEAKLKTVTVEKEEEGEYINSSVQIILSVANQDYIILKNNRITVTKDVYIQNNVQLGSEGATSNYGYRLYMNGSSSCLDVDTINVRNGLSTVEYIKVSFEELCNLVGKVNLKAEKWYVITDFQNHWKLPAKSTLNNRPLLIKALNSNSFYKEGKLFNNPNIVIHYDFNYQEEFEIPILTEDSSPEFSNNYFKARGKITFMRDTKNNEANFDFLDYSDYKENPLTVLHNTNLGNSIFPENSCNNKVVITDLKGITITNDKKLSNEGEIAFNLNQMQNNNFRELTNCIFNCNLIDCNFLQLKNCTFESGTLLNITCYSSISDYTFNSNDLPILYDINKIKEVYYINNEVKVYAKLDQYFYRGMIMMHSGIEPIPEGWAVCDGGSYTYDNKTITTPNLIGRFIKATQYIGDIKSVDVNVDNKVLLTEENLPAHNHPHNPHNHTLSGIKGIINNSGNLSLDLSYEDYAWDISTENETVINNITGTDITTTTISVVSKVENQTLGGEAIGGDHTHTITISEGTADSTTSTEQTKTWSNAAFSIEPNYYSLIFIMKL